MALSLDPTSLNHALAKGMVIVMNAKCSIDYNGRASSKAGEAWRLIIIKPDGSLLVHSNEGYQPLNWQPPGSRIYFSGRQIIAIRHRPHEVLKINIHDVAWVEVAIANEGDFRLQGTHEDVKEWVVKNLPRVTGCQNARLVGTEVPLNGHGVADVVADCGGTRVVIEVKRGIVDLNAVSQLKRYVDALPNAKGVLVGAWFTSGALELARELGFRIVEF